MKYRLLLLLLLCLFALGSTAQRTTTGELIVQIRAGYTLPDDGIGER